ncbi:MAG: DUF58 domain-containing protein [Verrucomicrobiae bacterium]|nr:DUF58 domain-containing protein [Verrucomicrobiae bacterium]
MSRPSDFLTPVDLQKIGNLQVLARLVVEGFCTGLHTSPHKGFSVEFREHRPYVQGDDIRRLDWKVFGKTDRLYVREYEEETNLRATLLVDASGSMAYAGNGLSKFQYAVGLAACLSYLMLQQSDSVGLVTFDEKIRRYIPPRARPGHLRVLLDALAETVPGGETELAGVFHQLVPKIHRRGLLIILSDCFGNVPELMSALAHFRHARHDIIVFQIWDRNELEFPFKQWTRFDSLESAGDKRLIDPVALRSDYMRNLQRFRQELKEGCHRHRVDLVPMTTDQPYSDALARYLARRMKTV